jgi:hypothetical protein
MLIIRINEEEEKRKKSCLAARFFSFQAQPF